MVVGGGGGGGETRSPTETRTCADGVEKYIRPAVVSAARREPVIGADGVLDAITFVIEVCEKIVVKF